LNYLNLSQNETSLQSQQRLKTTLEDRNSNFRHAKIIKIVVLAFPLKIARLGSRRHDI
jgi:hypothetical protein